MIFEHRDDLIGNLNDLIGHGKGVEIGVFKGEFSKVILSKWKGTLYMVDVWRGLGDEYDDMSNHNIHSDAYVETIQNINGYEDRGIMVRATSKTASEIFEDESYKLAFNEWQQDLTTAQIEQIAPKGKGEIIPQPAKLSIYFKENIWPSKKAEYLIGE